MQQLSDPILLQKMKHGDRAAFTEIYNRYWDKLFAVAGHKLHDLHVAEELVQDIFMDLWNRRDEIAVTGDLRAYLSVALKYKVINVQAKRRRSFRYEKHVITHSPQEDHSTEEWVRFQELKERLAALVKQLPEKCRLVYTLSRENGLSHRQIAEHLDISEKTVESHLTNALKSLRTRLGQFFSFFI